MDSLGLKLKETRKGLGFTLRKVEELSGISNAYLSQLENDKIKNPSANILSKLSEIYNISLKSLLSNAQVVERKITKEDNSNWTFAKKVAFSSEGLTEKEKKEVLRYLEFVKSHRFK